MKRVACLLAVVAMGSAGAVWSVAQERNTSDRVVEAITLPNKEYEISFPRMGVIKEVRVKEGEPVTKGQVMMVQDDTEDRAELEIYKADVNPHNIEAAKKESEYKDVRAQWSAKLHKETGLNEREMQETAAEAKIAEIKVKQAEVDLQQKTLKRDKQQVAIERMELKAPADGVVLKVVTDLGANVDPTKPSILVVQNNPLKVEVQVPALASLQMKKGDKMRVSYDRKNWRDATVSVLSPVAEAGSGWRKVYLELPNPDGEPSGMQAFVELPEKAVAAAAR